MQDELYGFEEVQTYQTIEDFISYPDELKGFVTIDGSQQYDKCNTKFKIYPDGKIVALYADKPKFSLSPMPRAKKKTVAPFPLSIDVGLCSLNIILQDPYFEVDEATGEICLRGDGREARYGNQNKRRKDKVKQTLDKLHDLVMCNDWKYFFTGTLGNDNGFDGTDPKEALKPLQNWLRNQVNRKGLKYVLVAELQPKSKRIHFHGFINDVLEVVDSGTKLYRGFDKPIKNETAQRKGLDISEGRTVYNCPAWRFGFTTLIEAYNGSQGCYNYICKYITKESKAVFGRYYWSSRNLNREPIIHLSDTDYSNINCPEYQIPRTNDKYKYFTFFPEETDFTINQLEIDNTYDEGETFKILEEYRKIYKK